MAEPTPVMDSPEWFLVQTSDLQLRQLSRSLADGGAHWWRAMFGQASKFQRRPIREEFGLPVYCVNLPANVVDAMLELLHFPSLVGPALLHAPAGVALAVWRKYLLEYGFTNEVFVDEEDSDEEATAERPSKKARNEAPERPYQEALMRIATDLHAYIFMHHPDAMKFQNGQQTELIVGLVGAHSRPRPPSCDVFHFGHPDLNGNDAYLVNFLFNLSDTNRALFLANLASLSPHGTRVLFRVLHRAQPYSKSPDPYACRRWPTSANGVPVLVSRQSHAVCELVFVRRQ